MSKPDFKANAGIYLFSWQQEQVAFRLDHIDESRSGVTAELTIQTTAPGIPPHIHQARFNLLSTVALTSLSRHLTERWNGVDWPGLLEQARVITLQEYRRGEPAVRIGSLPAREGLSWRVHPVLQELQPTLVFGDGGTGKSTFAVYLANLLDGQVEHNGLSVEPGKVLYLDYETDYYSTMERMQAIRKGLDAEHEPDIFYRFCARPFAEEIEEIQSLCLEHGIAVVMVDSFGLAIGPDSSNDDAPVRAFYIALRSLKLTSLVIDHMNKEGKLYGNRYKFNMARSVWEARSVQEPDEDKLTIGLYHRKSNYGKLLLPLGFTFTWENDAITVTRAQVKDVPELAAGMSLRAQMADLLRHGSMSTEQIAEELRVMGQSEIKEDSVRKVLNRYKQQFVPVYEEGNRRALWGLRLSEV